MTHFDTGEISFPRSTSVTGISGEQYCVDQFKGHKRLNDTLAGSNINYGHKCFLLRFKTANQQLFVAWFYGMHRRPQIELSYWDGKNTL